MRPVSISELRFLSLVEQYCNSTTQSVSLCFNLRIEILIIGRDPSSRYPHRPLRFNLRIEILIIGSHIADDLTSDQQTEFQSQN